ncbi:craniofacial development protein 2-like protein [Tanacetum coccineum]|uniref:Craniofacial development protein 2-like protein n=1 Tax=Tanacetum coccineum TaxID=301880 RepID=A0ABQ5GXN6_9ASTR
MTWNLRIKALVSDGHMRIKVDSWNIGSLTRKLLELVDVLKRYKADISCFKRLNGRGLVRGKETTTSFGCDLNGHVRAAANGYSKVHEGFGYGVRNEEGHMILEFAIAYNFMVSNSYFMKRDAI